MEIVQKIWVVEKREIVGRKSLKKLESEKKYRHSGEKR